MFRYRTRKIRLSDVLHGCAPGRIQSVGYMQVIPLVSDLSDDRFVSPVEGEADVFTTDYGTIGFRNTTDRVMIVPCHAGYVVKQAAQDHAMVHAGLVRPNRERKYDTAACIQQSQGGYIRRGAYQMLILPYALREQALQMRNERSYSKMWDAIGAFNRDLGIQGGSHLEFFLKHFRRELDEFVAEFECVPRQIGAIVLVDDQVVGVERAPSPSYWQSVWPCLIRECYGSLAIRIAQLKRENAAAPTSRVSLPDDPETLDDLAAAISEIAAVEDERARATVRSLLDCELALTQDESTAGLQIDTVECERFTGQVIRDGKRIVYASLPVARQWISDKKWRDAQPFAI